MTCSSLLPLVEPPSSPLVPWVCSTRYKTALCTSYAASGFCKYAERCQFAHGLRELHVPCRHPKYKTELCRNYHTAGYCFYGGRCLFVHSPTEMRQIQRHRKNIPCRKFLANGVCPFGKRCNFLHHKAWRPRGALCHTFSSFGFCLYGTSCCFQHGLPSKIKTADLSQGQFLSPQPTPGTAEVMVHNAFTFSSHHLNDLLLPLAIHLQQFSRRSLTCDNPYPTGENTSLGMKGI
uniref:mRNA decay activator protein ZFP36 n=1 Tax=Xiphophorus couchianus TaxID=32473 RepID=A0A3B5LA22_9TELE